MMTPPAKLYHISDYRAKYVRMSVIEDVARNLRAVQEYIEEHAADFQGESGVYVTHIYLDNSTATRERPARSSRLADRRYTQLIDAIDELKKPKRKRNKGGIS